MSVSYPCLKPMQSYIADHLERWTFFKKWIELGSQPGRQKFRYLKSFSAKNLPLWRGVFSERCIMTLRIVSVRSEYDGFCKAALWA